MPTSKRRRRTPEEAKAEILDAAQVILLRDGPTELKFQALAEQAGLAVSNVYHHFGGVLEIKQALAARVLNEINSDLASALTETNESDLTTYAHSVLTRMYTVLRLPRHAKLIGWIVLSTEIEALEGFASPLPLLVELVVQKMSQYLPTELSETLARKVIYEVAISAIGEGLIGDTLKSSLSQNGLSLDGADWLGEHWQGKLKLALAETTGTS